MGEQNLNPLAAKVADSKPSPEVTDKEVQNLSGEAGKGTTPAFGKHGGGEDENNPITSVEELESVKAGSAENSAPDDVDVAGILAAAGSPEEAPEDGSTEYVSDISRLRIGRFQFEDGRLNVPSDKVGDFEKLLSSAHQRTQNSIRKIDRSAGDVFARRYKGSMSSGVDTSDNGVRSPQPHA